MLHLVALIPVEAVVYDHCISAASTLPIDLRPAAMRVWLSAFPKKTKQISEPILLTFWDSFLTHRLVAFNRS